MNTSEKIQTSLSVLLTTLAFPIMFLNLAGGIISGIWLIIIGKLSLVIFSLLLTFIATKVLGLILAPTLLLMHPVAKALENKKYTKVYILSALANFWDYLVMTVWCVGSFIYIVNYTNSGSIWPYLLLGYCVATVPWTYIASHEDSNEVNASTIGTFFVCLGTIAMMMIAIFSKTPNLGSMLIVFIIAMLVAWIMQVILLISNIKSTEVRNDNNIEESEGAPEDSYSLFSDN